MPNTDANGSHPPTQAQPPRAINHLVLNVTDMEVSHRFWTEITRVPVRGPAEAGPRADAAEHALLQRRRFAGRSNPSRSGPRRSAQDVRERRSGPRRVEADAATGRAQPRGHRLARPRVVAQAGRLPPVEGRALSPPHQSRHDPQRVHLPTPTGTASRCCTSCPARCGKATSTPPRISRSSFPRRRRGARRPDGLSSSSAARASRPDRPDR